MQIYLGGPMFTAAEVTYNLALAARLRSHGFGVYCPNESEPINDKTRTDITGEKIYLADIEALETANVYLCQVSEDSGTNWEAGYFDCLARHVDPNRYWGVIGLATDIRLQSRPNPDQRGAENQAGYVNQFVAGGLLRSLGISYDEESLIRRLLSIREDHEVLASR
ncbi:MAG TPA: nucleoside 2-deoxyribosyltransferase [Thermomicrobiales bacterium]|nr:nucleoside 2-deoxyribosyltransferase [Thermomicrobiales bacterium]